MPRAGFISESKTVHRETERVQDLIQNFQESDQAFKIRQSQDSVEKIEGCILLVRRNSISLEISFGKLIYQVIQDDDFYAPILYELEDSFHSSGEKISRF